MIQPINVPSHPFLNPFDLVGIEPEATNTALRQKGLSPREAEVLTWIARGKMNSEIGMILHISHRTVSKHLEHIYIKLGVECRTAALVQLFEIIQDSHTNQMTTDNHREVKTNQKLVLLVDDDIISRMAIRSLLESQRYNCLEVENGAAALAWLDKCDADLVITDNQMPVLGGIQLLECLATRRKNAVLLPAIVYSGNLSEEMRKRALKAGAFAILRRPCSFNKLLSVVAQALGSASTARYSSVAVIP